VSILLWGYFFTKSRKILDRILSLKSSGYYVVATIVDMETFSSKNNTSYMYICRDNKTGEQYDSDKISNPEFEV
jgi:hypothetical protein